MTQEEFIKWATDRGWEKDRFGHLHRNDRRFKISRIAVRYEVKSSAGDGWVRLRSGYFSKLSVTPEGKLTGLSSRPPGFPPARSQC